MSIDWNPVTHLGPIPINWYGLTWVLGFLIGGAIVRRDSARYGIKSDRVETAVLWIALGTLVGARLYYVVQNDFTEYLRQPWRMLAFWESGLAFFGGLFGGILAAWIYTRQTAIPFGRLADLFAPAVPVGSTIGRISCFLDGMDYGTTTQLPWGVIYTNPHSYAPNDGVSRHPDQVYELIGDLAIAALLFKLRGRFRDGSLFLVYLILFSVLRFFLFFVRGWARGERRADRTGHDQPALDDVSLRGHCRLCARIDDWQGRIVQQRPAGRSPARLGDWQCASVRYVRL